LALKTVVAAGSSLRVMERTHLGPFFLGPH
jgi:hypothetical protein